MSKSTLLGPIVTIGEPNNIWEDNISQKLKKGNHITITPENPNIRRVFK